MRIKILLTIVLLTSAITNIYAQEVEGNLNIHTFADNREYARSNRFSQTIFGVRFSPEVGLLLDSTHRIRVGFNALHEFGSSKFTDKIDPVVYYQYVKQNWNFNMGVFPRREYLSDFPRAVLTDTLNYYRPNVEGMLLKFENENWKQLLFIDWTSRQTATARENFIFGLSGRYKKDMFFISHYAMMLHDAGPAINIPGDHIRDNGALVAKIGLDFGHKTFLDSLTFNTGGLMSFERERSVGGWRTPKGILLEMFAEYHRFGITNSFYKGEAHHIMYGDQFYTAKTYNRLDLSWRPKIYKGIEGQFTLSFHFLDGVVDSQQAFAIRYNISGSKSLKKSNAN
ncbi:NAD(P)-dependent oxidoreductase [Pedobacter foliorum]|uniref:NAD(P)-dependent oxidoreductase n=1 Tax=Pedobacter foliorum TaxID=2739058 RepID=UPI001566A1A6|nr:NAD(P)-dependent oxidoreductase [Pedobacter foliorum]NRF38012.1 NAD(P)-dependent oxidoreductase [Pedobacter foliorum]